MSVKELKYFATHSLNHDSRDVLEKNNLNAASSKKSLLSKFGVGAKQAGFYLGERLRVITLQKDSVASKDAVKEFCLDELELDEKFSKNGNDANLYSGKIYSRPVGEVELHASEDEKTFQDLIIKLKEHEVNFMNSNFTIIVIKLRPEIIIKLLNEIEIESLARNMAQIYYFYLHPKHQFNQLCNGEDKRFKITREKR